MPLAAEAIAHEPIRYGRDIRPLLADRCFTCHGPDPAKREAGLRLDTFDGATAARGTSERPKRPAIVPGDPEQSELVARIAHADLDERMPPRESNRRPLGEDEIALVRRWIDEGARYEPHWAFVAPAAQPVPAVRDASWPRNEIDRFVLANLERHDVAPSEPTDRATLLRRVFLDLTGLPPTPEELDAFLADARPDAYEQWVDRLLRDEPYRSRYAERMAAPWLDAARYADTCGIHMDAGRQIWPWRDWVLAAFREHMPFDRFVIEQLAGDLLPDATQEQRVASGFNRNHVTTDEGGAIAEEYLVEYAVDRVATTGSVFLGLTVGCARCHDHKFDPITQQDFYGLYAFFNSVEEPGLYSQLPDPNRAFEPFMRVPTREQAAALAALEADLASARAELGKPDPDEDGELARQERDLVAHAAGSWEPRARVVEAKAASGATLTVLDDGSVLASGENPDRDEHVIVLTSEREHLDALLLEALTDPSLPEGKVGRSGNGNAVLGDLRVQATSLRDRSITKTVAFSWARADHEQADGDFGVLNAIDGSRESGWAVDAHRRSDGRAALFLADLPFGFEGGVEVTVTLGYHSEYAKHALGRVRIALGSIGNADALPTASSDWYLVGPFPGESRAKVYDTEFGPETDATLDRTRNFGAGNQYWRHVAEYADGRLNTGLAEGVNASYVGKRLVAPSARKHRISIGSDDAARIWLDGRLVFEKRVDRGLAADQDEFELELSRGAHVVVFKIVNTGGPAGFYWRAKERDRELAEDLVWIAGPEGWMAPPLRERFVAAWRVRSSPTYRAALARVTELEARTAEGEAKVPLTMVMKELETPRETFVLDRGQYDQPDRERKVERAIPKVFGELPPDAPRDRLGLAKWLVSDENPLVARVAVNRAWELVFGAGLTRSSEDFGYQGEWPSHPELLDWLALDLRDHGWDLTRTVARIVTSATYRQSSRARADLRERDPENRWLAYFPRRRLSAEQIRDQALYAAGLLVERFGGPSVKPYQPAGLWEEVAMVQSNTRVYERGAGDDLWRRSLYTYWKRAAPPPSMLTFDAPTREFCAIARPVTNTPLQALVLWNDEQFVEAARALAARTLSSGGDDRERLSAMHRRVTARSADGATLDALARTLDDFRARYAGAPQDARALLSIGVAPPPSEVDPAELAAWTMVASALFSLDAAITRG